MKFYVALAAKKEKDQTTSSYIRMNLGGLVNFLGHYSALIKTLLALVSRVTLHSESSKKYGSPVRI